MLISLKTIIENLSKTEIDNLLSSFSCPLDNDIEFFLNSKAVQYEILSKGRTYLVCDSDELENKDISDITIYGYITLAQKVLTVPDNVSNNMRKQLDGLSCKIHGELLKHFNCYLIGQLARNSIINNSQLKGRELINFAKSIILAAVNAVGGRYMLIECKDEPKLIDFYHSNGFQEISRQEVDGHIMVQMICKLI